MFFVNNFKSIFLKLSMEAKYHYIFSFLYKKITALECSCPCQVEIHGRGTALIQLQNRFRSRPKTTFVHHSVTKRESGFSQPYYDDLDMEKRGDKTVGIARRTVGAGHQTVGAVHQNRGVRNVEITDSPVGPGSYISL
jgi:hypothetical protein